MSLPLALVDRVDVVLSLPVGALPGAWPRASALLLRQALESAMAGVWAVHSPALERASFSTQLSCLRAFVSDERVVAEARHTWHSLSGACHHRGYGLPPSRESLALWSRRVRALVEELERVPK